MRINKIFVFNAIISSWFYLIISFSLVPKFYCLRSFILSPYLEYGNFGKVISLTHTQKQITKYKICWLLEGTLLVDPNNFIIPSKISPRHYGNSFYIFDIYQNDRQILESMINASQWRFSKCQMKNSISNIHILCNVVDTIDLLKWYKYAGRMSVVRSLKNNKVYSYGRGFKLNKNQMFSRSVNISCVKYVACYLNNKEDNVARKSTWYIIPTEYVIFWNIT